MTRLLRILRRIVTALSLLLCLALLLAAFNSRSSPRLVWFHHAGPWPHYHIASLRDYKITLALYRETSLSPMAQDLQSLIAREARTDFEVEKQTKILQRLMNSPGTEIQISMSETMLQAARAEQIAAQMNTSKHRAVYDLPPNPGFGSAILSGRPLRTLPRPSQNLPPNYADTLMRRLNNQSPTATVANWQRAGLAYTSGSTRYARWRVFQIPLWLILPLLLILPIHSAWSVRKSRRRRKLNLCPSCGYDLRASPNLCPECGTSRQPTRASTV